MASALYFVGIQKTSLTNATLLNYTFVIWGPIIAYFVLKETLHDRHKVVLPIALAGVVLITRPDFGHIHLGDAIALFSGFMAATALVSVRLLRRTETATAIFFYFNLVGVPISLLLAFATKTTFIMPSHEQLPLLFGVIATSVAAQMMMTFGYRALNTAEGGLLSLTTNIYSALLAFLFFSDPLPWQTLVGGGMILLSAASLQFTPPSVRRADAEPSE
jgi:drug/metabolite transporter (DMT)-like permease